MLVSAELSVVSASAGRPRRSSLWRRPLISAARCWASAAEPPLPKISHWPPCARLSETMRPARSREGTRVSSTLTFARMEPPRYSRMKPSSPAAALAFVVALVIRRSRSGPNPLRVLQVDVDAADDDLAAYQHRQAALVVGDPEEDVGPLPEHAVEEKVGLDHNAVEGPGQGADALLAQHVHDELVALLVVGRDGHVDRGADHHGLGAEIIEARQDVLAADGHGLLGVLGRLENQAPALVVVIHRVRNEMAFVQVF